MSTTCAAFERHTWSDRNDCHTWRAISRLLASLLLLSWIQSHHLIMLVRTIRLAAAAAAAASNCGQNRATLLGSSPLDSLAFGAILAGVDVTLQMKTTTARVTLSDTANLEGKDQLVVVVGRS